MRQQHTRKRRAEANTHPSPLQLATLGSITPPLPASRPAIAAMTPDELRAWIGSTRAALQKKMARERAYLDRRAAPPPQPMRHTRPINCWKPICWKCSMSLSGMWRSWTPKGEIA